MTTTLDEFRPTSSAASCVLQRRPATLTQFTLRRCRYSPSQHLAATRPAVGITVDELGDTLTAYIRHSAHRCTRIDADYVSTLGRGGIIWLAQRT